MQCRVTKVGSTGLRPWIWGVRLNRVALINMPASHMGNDAKFGRCRLKGMDGSQKNIWVCLDPSALGWEEWLTSKNAPSHVLACWIWLLFVKQYKLIYGDPPKNWIPHVLYFWVTQGHQKWHRLIEYIYTGTGWLKLKYPPDKMLFLNNRVRFVCQNFRILKLSNVTAV